MQRAPTGTVTFLFSDVEGSTRRWQDEPEAMRALLVEHDAIWRDVIDKRHGYLFKHTGDGVAAVFASAADAVSAAVDAQARLVEVLAVRVGLHTGEAELRDGDYFGSTLNRCARLMGIAHGGQIVISEATAALVRDRDDLHDLGEHRLRDLSRAEHVWQVGGGEFAALRSLDNYPTNLALQSSSFVGRAADITQIGRLLVEHPCVTLTGVGGVGKTRLAIEVGADVLPHYADGVWLVELAPIAHDQMVLSTIAEVLGVAAQAGEPLVTTLVGRLKSKQLLVILDNCEHVLSPVARFVDRLAGTAPAVRVLATSREPLGINAERVKAVPPLAEGTEAVELFVDRAAQAGATFDSPEQQRAIGEICVRLDGIPLAIELAAARARMMAPTQILERLDQRFRLLTGGGRTAVERHRTLQATVAWSYDLLDDTERTVFQRLSTLAGSFDLDAAEAIGAGGAVEDFDAIDALGRLVDKSMVLTVPAPTGVRYRMLETLRQFAADRLAEQPEATDVRDRHATYWCDRAVTLGRAMGGTDQNVVLDAVDTDVDNYRAAFAHFLSTGRVDTVAHAMVRLGVYWPFRRGREGLRWFEQLLAAPDLDVRHRLRVLAEAAELEWMVGGVRAAERQATEALELAAAAGVDASWGAYHALMMGAAERGDREGYRRWWERAHEVFANVDNQFVRLMADTVKSPSGAWDIEELIEHHERLQAEIHRYGDPLLIASANQCFAVVLSRAGQADRARSAAAAALDASRIAGPLLLVGCSTNIAAIDILDGVIDRGPILLAEALPVARDHGLTHNVLCCLFVAAGLAAQRRDLESAAVLHAGTARHADPLGISDLDLLAHDCRALARAAIDAHPADLTAARRRGEAMSIDELVDFAMESLR